MRESQKNGETLEGIPARVAKDRINMPAPLSLAPEEGDTLRREVPGGVIEEYEIFDSGYSPAHKNVSARYYPRARKMSAIDSRPSRVVYNVQVTGANARFNLHLVDLSSNIQDVNTPELFEKLRDVLSKTEDDEKRRAAIVLQEEKMEVAPGTTSLSEHYKGFVSLAADHIALLAPFTPALSQLIM